MGETIQLIPRLQAQTVSEIRRSYLPFSFWLDNNNPDSAGKTLYQNTAVSFNRDYRPDGPRRPGVHGSMVESRLNQGHDGFRGKTNKCPGSCRESADPIVERGCRPVEIHRRVFPIELRSSAGAS